MNPRLKIEIKAALAKDHNRNREHQTNLMMRLTKEQAEYLGGLHKLCGVRPGTFMRRLLIIAMVKHRFKDRGIAESFLNTMEDGEEK